MDKNTISFLILCVSLIVIVFGIYTYNNKKYNQKSIMAVLPIEDTSLTDGTYIISQEDTFSVSTILETSNSSITVTTVELTTTSKEITTTKTTTAKTITSKVTDTSVSFPISLNSITYDELICIKGIGPSTAQKIIDYRNSIGGYFTSRYQLLEINGIGESKMNTILEYTYIENENLDYYNQDNSNNNVDIDVVQDNPIEENVQDNSYSQQDIQSTVEYPINLNTATLEQLCTIPNVTEEIAQEILSLRDTIQYFSNPYELLYTDSISETFLSEIINYVSVE